MINNKDILIKINNLSVDFPVGSNLAFWKKQVVNAVSEVTLEIPKGEAYGLVGESGCGKTTLANTLIGLVKPTSGKVFYKEDDVYEVSRDKFIDIRSNMQLIFQDPYSSLNPRLTVRDIIAEPFVIRTKLSSSEIDERVAELLELVGLSTRDMDRHIYDFSGGQRQRIAIARAIALNPEFLICDEPVSALDVSVHAQILNLLMKLQKELNLTYLFISHNLAVVKNVCSYVGVMYLGKIVEYGSVDSIFNNPQHPYTKALLSAVDDDEQERIVLEGDIPSPIDPPSGCRFSTRCYKVMDICRTECPANTIINDNHIAACHLLNN